MPNWCVNKLVVSGPKEEISKFKEAVKGKSPVYYETEKEKQLYASLGLDEKNDSEKFFTLNSIVPVPEDVLQKGYSEAGHKWQSENWGTKWDLNEEDIEFYESNTEDKLFYEFDTAWSPPIPWVWNASKKFPSLGFEIMYFEPGMGFTGITIFENGEVVTDKIYQSETEFWEFAKETFGFTPDEYRGG